MCDPLGLTSGSSQRRHRRRPCIDSGAPSVPGSGSSLSSIDNDLRALVSLFPDDLAAGYFAMSRSTAMFLSLPRGSGGSKAYPELEEGRLLGLPVLISSSAKHAGSPGGSFIALIATRPKCSSLTRDVRRIDVSTVASLQMTSTPAAGGASLMSLWSANCTAFKALRWAGRLQWRRSDR
jgi:hypothetical protein